MSTPGTPQSSSCWSPRKTCEPLFWRSRSMTLCPSWACPCMNYAWMPLTGRWSGKEWSLCLTQQGSFRSTSIGAFGAEPLDFQSPCTSCWPNNLGCFWAHVLRPDAGTWNSKGLAQGSMGIKTGPCPPRSGLVRTQDETETQPTFPLWNRTSRMTPCMTITEAKSTALRVCLSVSISLKDLI